MYVCQWHLDIHYGKQTEALRILRAWGDEAMTSSEFRRAKGSRLMVGHVGVSASHVIAEWVLPALGDLDAALQGMTSPQFRRLSEELAPLIAPGSQHWLIYRVAE